MERKQSFKINLKLFTLIAGIFLLYGCEQWYSPGNLTVSHIEFDEIDYNEICYLPDGVYTPDNPDFDFNKPETWTGNMAQYVNHNYIYSVTYQISNSGGCTAYDTEIDLYYIFDNGDESVETIYIGDIKPNKSISETINVTCTNKQLIECCGEVYWYD